MRRPTLARAQRIVGEELQQEESPKDHGILMAHPTLAVNFIPPPFERLLLEGKVFAGVALNPSAQRYDDFLTKPQWYLSTFGLNAGFSLGFKYMTLLTNFVVGMDLAFYSMFSPGWGQRALRPRRWRRLAGPGRQPVGSGQWHWVQAGDRRGVQASGSGL